MPDTSIIPQVRVRGAVPPPPPAGEARVPPSRADGADALLARLIPVAACASAGAADLDNCGTFPSADLGRLAEIGALTAPLPKALGGMGAGTEPAGTALLVGLLRIIGHASLPLGRIFEGHVNALALVCRYGTPAQARRAASDAAQGRVFGVWNTEGHDGVRLQPAHDGWLLSGSKIFASGAGFIERPLITARTEAGDTLMVLAPLEREVLAERSDLSAWSATGMRASATGRFDFTGLPIAATDLVGSPGDYHRQPAFSAGAWRFLAVQLGGIERLLDEARTHLVAAGRQDDAAQLARMGQAATAAETARLWVVRAAEIAGSRRDPDAVIAYVNLARGAVERAGLDVLEHVTRAVGLSGFLAPHPIERISRDLSTYLRQPAPDRALAEGARHLLAQSQPVSEVWS